MLSQVPSLFWLKKFNGSEIIEDVGIEIGIFAFKQVANYSSGMGIYI